MARDFRINGEALVRVKGGAHMSGNPIGTTSELGLAVGEIRIVPSFKHRDMYVDDFGPEVPAEIMCQLADVRIDMSLIHYDLSVLDICLAESMGGVIDPNTNFPAGTLRTAGAFLGNYLQPGASGCHFISLNISSPRLALPWRFPTSFLTMRPLELPLGTKHSIVGLTWRAIPYYAPTTSGGEILSSGRVLWDHTEDQADPAAPTYNSGFAGIPVLVDT